MESPMSTLSKLRFVPALALTVLAACGGGGGGGSTPGVQLPPSMLSPLPGQLTGNWVLNNINVVQGTGIGGIRTGMNLRLSASSVEVFLGDYVGADSILPKLMKDWFGSELNLQQAVTGTSFTLSLRSDFGRVFNLDPLKWYTTVDVTGQLTGSNVVVTMTNNDYLPNNAAPITNVVELTFGPGQNVVPLSGNWQVSQVSQVSSLAFPLTQAQLAPLPNEVVAGDILRLGTTEIAEIFGIPFPEATLTTKFPELDVRNHYGFLGNGAAQGFVAWEGIAQTGFDGIVGVIDLNLFHTGDKLQGDLIVIGIKDKSQTGLYHVYLELQPESGTAPAMVAGYGRPAAWMFPSEAEHAALALEFGR
jgi:hypothetical protein